jgi:hypothetical protein
MGGGIDVHMLRFAEGRVTECWHVAPGGLGRVLHGVGRPARGGSGQPLWARQRGRAPASPRRDRQTPEWCAGNHRHPVVRPCRCPLCTGMNSILRRPAAEIAIPASRGLGHRKTPRRNGPNRPTPSAFLDGRRSVRSERCLRRARSATSCITHNDG